MTYVSLNNAIHDDGDHGVMPVTKMIMVPRRWRSKEHDDIGHIITTVVNKMIPHNNFKKVFPLTVHRCESSLFRSTTVNLTSLACTDMASEHGDRKVEHESYRRYDQHEDVHRS
ncbi:hypothetical protein T12_7622 [Trichinella patagoniensis]|uniref:Uncharacterized protein n=1 Tax=Trichinella patagoniensis TaxID=990121 RepID=A0A0V0YZ06_9BILA|nr:hypothetical protein T12_7622 [Trichinella patagoniensis]